MYVTLRLNKILKNNIKSRMRLYLCLLPVIYTCYFLIWIITLRSNTLSDGLISNDLISTLYTCTRLYDDVIRLESMTYI